MDMIGDIEFTSKDEALYAKEIIWSWIESCGISTAPSGRR
jgi:hypothetical protein